MAAPPPLHRLLCVHHHRRRHLCSRHNPSCPVPPGDRLSRWSGCSLDPLRSCDLVSSRRSPRSHFLSCSNGQSELHDRVRGRRSLPPWVGEGGHHTCHRRPLLHTSSHSGNEHDPRGADLTRPPPAPFLRTGDNRGRSSRHLTQAWSREAKSVGRSRTRIGARLHGGGRRRTRDLVVDYYGSWFVSS